MTLFVNWDDVEGFKIAFDVDTEFGPFFIFVGCGNVGGFFGEVADVSEGGFYLVVFSKKTTDSTGFGGGFDDYKSFCHDFILLRRGCFYRRGGGDV